MPLTLTDGALWNYGKIGLMRPQFQRAAAPRRLARATRVLLGTRPAEITALGMALRHMRPNMGVGDRAESCLASPQWLLQRPVGLAL